MQLARVEATRLVKNPVVWLAIAVMGVVVQRVDEASGVHFLLVGYGVLLPGFVLLIACAAAARRDRTSGATELMATMSTGEPARLAGFGLAGAAAGGGLALAVTAVVWLLRARDSTLGTTSDTMPPNVMVPRPNAAQFLQGPLAVVVLCALGVLLGRLLPSWLVVIALLLPAMIQLLWLGMWSGVATNETNWWFPLSSGWVTGEWIGCRTGDPMCDLPLQGFDRVTPWWHLPYLAAIAVLLVITAVLLSRRNRNSVLAWLGAATTVVAFAAIQAAVHTPFTSVASIGG
jgi:hypothetical protein